MDKYIVYKHISPSGKVYIGITKNKPNKRWQNGKGYTKGNQPVFERAIKKYGWNNFKHVVLLENISESEAKYAEVYLVKWYKTHHLSYNMKDGGDCGNSMKGDKHPMFGRHETAPMYGIRGSDNPNSIKVYQYTREGVFVREWESIIEAASTFNNKLATATGITACCKGKLPACKGFIWSYTLYDICPNVAPKHEKEVYQYSYKGELLNFFKTIKDAGEYLGLKRNNHGSIAACCKGNAVSAHGYFWSYNKHDKYIPTDNPRVITWMMKALNKY